MHPTGIAKNVFERSHPTASHAVIVVLCALVVGLMPVESQAQTADVGEAPDSAETPERREPELNLWTVAAISSTAYLVAQMQHEGLGHASACLLGGGRVSALSTAVAGCDGLSPGGERFVDMAGTMVDLGVGAGLTTTLYLAPPSDPSTYYAIWLLSSVSLLQTGGYLMVFPWLGEGDWSTDGALRGAEPKLAWQIGVSALGLGITAATIPIMNQLLEPLLGASPTREKRRWGLTLLAYGVGSSLITAGALFDRTDSATGIISATAATFGGTLMLAYLPLFFTADVYRFGDATDQPAKPIPFQWGWVAVGALSAVASVAILGPGFGRGFPEPHPLGR